MLRIPSFGGFWIASEPVAASTTKSCVRVAPATELVYAAPTTLRRRAGVGVAVGEGELAVDRRCAGVRVGADRAGVGVEAQVLPGAHVDADAVDGGVEVEAEGGRLERRIDRRADGGRGAGGGVDGVDDAAAGESDEAAVGRTDGRCRRADRRRRAPVIGAVVTAVRSSTENVASSPASVSP